MILNHDPPSCRSANGVRRALLTVCMAAVAMACGRERAAPPLAGPGPSRITVAERASLGVIGSDTLSDSAHIVSILGETDGNAIVFTFADPARHIIAGLGMIDRTHRTPQLLWPDSVTSMSWSAPHQLTFTSSSGRATYIVLDIHAPHARLDTVIARANSVPLPTGPTRTLPAPVQSRVAAYIDSIRAQPAGIPQHSAPHYAPVTFLTSPDNKLAAAYVVATSTQGEQANPGWYLIRAPGRAIQPIDSIVGPASGMPGTAASWLGSDVFAFAKGKAIYAGNVRTGAAK